MAPATVVRRRPHLLRCFAVAATVFLIPTILPAQTLTQLELEASLDGSTWKGSGLYGDIAGWLRLRVKCSGDNAGAWYSLACDPWFEELPGLNNDYFDDALADDRLKRAPPQGFGTFLYNNAFPGVSLSNRDYYNTFPTIFIDNDALKKRLRKALFVGGLPIDNSQVFGDPLWYAAPTLTQEFGAWGVRSPTTWDAEMDEDWIQRENKEDAILAYNVDGIIQRWIYKKIQTSWPDPTLYFASNAWQHVEKWMRAQKLYLEVQAIGVRGDAISDPTLYTSSGPLPTLAPYPGSAGIRYTDASTLTAHFAGSGAGGPGVLIKAPGTVGTATPRLAQANAPMTENASGYESGMQLSFFENGVGFHNVNAYWGGFGLIGWIMPNRPGKVLTLWRFRYVNPAGGYYEWVNVLPPNRRTYAVQ
jgi:hypothetical protein